MSSILLTSEEVQRARTLLANYFSQQHNQSQLYRDTQEGKEFQDLFRNVLLNDGCPNDKDFLDFLRSEIWAIKESLRFGLMDDIVQNNTVGQIREAFRNMLSNALDISDPDAVLARGRRPYLGVSILSEALCKVYPNDFSIKNKKSEWGLYFIVSDASPSYIEHEISYSDFIDISWQIWNLIADEYGQREFDFDPNRRLWYVDRFYLWLYHRPETRQIMDS
jgi:hypothetical protein